jgi:preprotein translocase subunit YajC
MEILLFLLPLLLVYVLLIRPQQRRIRETQAMVTTLEVGDDVITSGGIYGTVTDADDTTLWVEVAPDVVVRMMRGAIAQRVTADDDEYEEDSDDDIGSDEADTSVPERRALDTAPRDDDT